MFVRSFECLLVVFVLLEGAARAVAAAPAQQTTITDAAPPTTPVDITVDALYRDDVYDFVYRKPICQLSQLIFLPMVVINRTFFLLDKNNSIIIISRIFLSNRSIG